MKNKEKFDYAQKTTTSICFEKPLESNPFVAENRYLFGYELTELTQKKSFLEVLLLLNTGEFPSEDAVTLMNALMIALINLGPRNPAVRAAMVAGISKTNTAHILPIGLNVLGGEIDGTIEVERSMHFIKKHMNEPHELALKRIDLSSDCNTSQHRLIPGLGTAYGQKDIVCCNLAKHIGTLNGAGNAFHWFSQLIDNIGRNDIDWLPTGLAAAVFLDLGISPREGAAMFQLICAPGILAHGLEQTHKPIKSMPFLEDSQYEYEN